MNAINGSAVAIAALATFVVGGPWYSPAMFLKPWQREMQLSGDRGHPARVFGLAYAFSLVACACLSLLLPAGAGWVDGLRLGALVGTGFVAASFGVNYQFANRSWRVLAIDGGYHIVQFAAFGAVLGAWPA